MSSHIEFAKQAPGVTGVSRDHPAESGYSIEILDAEQGIVAPRPEPRRKIAVCGFAASSRNLAPFTDATYEIWGLNQLYRHIPRATRWFDIHANWREDNVEGTDHPGWLAQCGMPVYMSQREPSIPTSVSYPLQRVIQKTTGVDYFTSTVAFMIALAIAEFDEQVEREAATWDLTGWTADKFRGRLADAYSQREIGIFGIDLIVGTEWDFQKPCAEYLLGLAQARNITLRLPPQCAMLKQRWRYGYEIEPSSGFVKLTELQKRQAAIQSERNQLIARLQTLEGAAQENGYWAQVVDLRSKGGTVRLNEDTAS